MMFGDYLKRVLATLLLLIFIYALWSARSILLLAFASIVIAIAIAQPMLFLQKKGVKRGIALTLAILLSFPMVPSPARAARPGAPVAASPEATWPRPCPA